MNTSLNLQIYYTSPLYFSVWSQINNMSHLQALALWLLLAMLVESGVSATEGEGVPLLSSSFFSDLTLGDSTGGRKADCKFA